MDIFEFAIKKEKVAEQNYRSLARRTDNKGFAQIFRMLAEEEKKHQESIERMSRNIPPQIRQTTLLSDAAEVFEKIKEDFKDITFEQSEIDLYRRARDLERQSQKFYLQKAAEVKDEQQEAIFRQLAEEEKKHLKLLEAICDFVQRPQTYLENAEFYHFADYGEDEF